MSGYAHYKPWQVCAGLMWVHTWLLVINELFCFLKPLSQSYASFSDLTAGILLQTDVNEATRLFDLIL